MPSKLYGAGLFATLLAGCSLFVSLDDLQPGAANVEDAALSEGSTSDASPDAVASGTDGALSDAGVDACVFCDDFDDRTKILGRWDNVTGNGDITNAQFVSPPNSAHFHLDPLASGPAFDNLSVTVPLTAGATSVDMDVKLATDISGAGGYLALLNFTLNGDYAGSFTGSATTWASDYWVEFPDGGHYQDYKSAGIVPDVGWHHVHYAIRYDPTNGTFAVTFDGTDISSGANLATFATTSVPSAVAISIGISANADLPATDVYIDNVHVQ